MMQQYMKELEQEPFDPEEFVERLAWRIIDSSREDGNSTFDPVVMNETFLQAIKDLQLLQERQHKKCERLEALVREEELNHWQDISQLQDKNKNAVSMFQELDERINYVATKVIHLGDQLESVNTPRSRAVEAQKLMNYFAEFLSPGPLLVEVFSDKTQIDEAADVIQKLHLIAQELPSGKFEEAKKKILAKYDEIERALIEEFMEAHKMDNIARMKEIASILSNFRGYSQCVDAFIEQSQMDSFVSKDVFSEVIPLCEKNFSLIIEVFSNPEPVMAKFVLNIYHLKLQKYVVGRLSDKPDTDKHLKNLMDLYTRTVQLSKDLSKFNMGTDENYLTKLNQNVFQKYFEAYISLETKSLREKSIAALQKFYDSKGHQKKIIQSGGFQDLRRDIQAVIGTRANINIAQIEDYGGETFISEEVAIALLQDTKLALHRCQVLSQPSELANNATQILEVLLQQLIVDHLDYALELGLQAVPIAESKTQQPHIYFFDVVRQANAIVHLIEKLFNDSLLPLVINTSKHDECLIRKRQLLEQIEMKLDTGLDRSINAIVGWVRIYLQTEQKKTDFKPESDVDTLNSPACSAVVQYMSSVISRIRDSLDGKNVEGVMMELGTRFHRVIYEHLQQFQYNSSGAMCVICDVNEYRKCIKELHCPLVNSLFDSLHALCNLLLVKPENLKQVCNGEQLVSKLEHDGTIFEKDFLQMLSTTLWISVVSN
ncbi:exocyst complex component Sec10 isoform X2 [Lycorma delicatula]|uniref:exocyst complex component Sec10 isoform X2 n=1 Tax=Lycorma delicatula TaxID=130591 RepID=UPI003F51A247